MDATGPVVPAGVWGQVKVFFSRVVYAIGPARLRRWYVLVALAVVVTALEAFAAIAIGALLALVVSPEGSSDLPILGELEVFSAGGSAPYTGAAVALFLFFAFRGACLLFQIYAQSRIGQNTGVELSARLLDGYLRMPYAFHLSRPSAELIRNAYTTAAEVVVYVLVPLVQGISEVLVIVGLATVLLLASPGPALAAGATVAFGIYLIQRVTRPRLLAYGAANNKHLSTTLESLQQAITGAREIRTLGAEHFFLSGFVEERRKLARASYMRSTVADLPRILVETALVLGVVFLLVLTISSKASPRETLAAVGLFAYAAFRALPSVNRIVAAVNNCRFGAAALKIVCDDLERVEVRSSRSKDDYAIPGLVHEVALDKIAFRYDGATDPALSDVSLRITAGESIGIAGDSGSGKSTLVHVIAGLLTPSEGHIRVNNGPAPANGWRWSGQVGFVPQEVFLVNDTIRRNICLGLPDQIIEQERLDWVLQLTQLDQTVAECPDGLSTVVGDRGMRLSGGQRQRISIARALYHAPDLLILDEGTSALDVLTERKVIEGLARSATPRTLIHVAHRLTSLHDSDRILVLEGGRLTDQGSFSELASRNDAFREAARAARTDVT